MAITRTNKYRYVLDGVEGSVLASDISKVCEIFTATLEDLTSVRLTETGIMANIPEADVLFKTSVLSAEAEAAGCAAYPSSYTVKESTPVVFSAVPAAGYEFVNWTRGVTILGTEATLSIPVTKLTGGELIADIVANFEPVAP